MPSIGTGAGGSGIDGSGFAGSGAGALLELPPQAVNKTAKPITTAMLFNDTFNVVPTLAYVYSKLIKELIIKYARVNCYWAVGNDHS